MNVARIPRNGVGPLLKALALKALAITALALSVVSAHADHHASAASNSDQSGGHSAAGKWTLDDEGSEISFVTVKAGDIAEAHTLGRLSGGVTFAEGAGEEASGDLNVSVHLESVETNIPIRNERMREFLFEIARFPMAKVHGHISAEEFLHLPVGDSATATLKLMLDLHGERIPVTANVLALRLAEGRMMVTSTTPVIVNAASVGLVAGIDKLQQLASLPSISKAVPVSFVLTFLK